MTVLVVILLLTTHQLEASPKMRKETKINFLWGVKKIRLHTSSPWGVTNEYIFRIYPSSPYRGVVYVLQGKSSGFNFVNQLSFEQKANWSCCSNIKQTTTRKQPNLLPLLSISTPSPTITLVLHYCTVINIKMKLALLASVIGAASAFAPASNNNGGMCSVLCGLIFLRLHHRHDNGWVDGMNDMNDNIKQEHGCVAKFVITPNTQTTVKKKYT